MKISGASCVTKFGLFVFLGQPNGHSGQGGHDGHLNTPGQKHLCYVNDPKPKISTGNIFLYLLENLQLSIYSTKRQCYKSED